jgi:HlyD family secretion protein
MSTKKRIPIVIGVVVVVFALLIVIFRGHNSRAGLLVSGTVEATEAQLGFQATGRIEEITAREGDPVKAGEELARLDRTEVQARKDQAEAQVAGARALLSELESGFRSEEVAQARAARDAAQDRLNDAQRDMERTKKLHDGGAVSLEVYDKAVTLADVVKSQYTQAAEQLRLIESGVRKERIEAQRAALAQAEAAARTIDALLANTTVHSAFDGIVTVRHREPGEIVPAG